MFTLITSTVVCITALVAILLIQHGGIPTIHIKHEHINMPPEQMIPVPEDLPSMSEEDVEADKKDAPQYSDIVTLVNSFLEGDVDNA